MELKTSLCQYKTGFAWGVCVTSNYMPPSFESKIQASRHLGMQVCMYLSNAISVTLRKWSGSTSPAGGKKKHTQKKAEEIEAGS